MKIRLIKKTVRLSVFAVMLCASIVTINSSAFAGLLITPLQAVMEGRQRSTQIILINTGPERATYRLNWEQIEQSQKNGRYMDSDLSLGSIYLKDFAVFTPRQITLEPGDKQTIRIAVRRPQDLENGEYKSHLHFGIVSQPPSRQEKNKNMADNEFKIGARVETSYTLPIVYRIGSYDIGIKIGKPKFEINGKTGNLLVKLGVEREGLHGVIGQIDLYHTPQGGQEVLISSLGNANIFPEITSREFTMATVAKTLSPGTLRIVFQKAEGKKNAYVTLDERTFPVGR